LIKTKSWAGKKFTPYKIDAPVENADAAMNHPLRRTINDLREAYVSLGFREVSGPIIEPAFWVFDHLFMPQDHPAREVQDAFFLGRPKELEIKDKALVERIKKARYPDEVVVATTINKTDEPIVELCDEIGCKYFRGSEIDVLGRVLGAARSVKAAIIVEILGDCPLTDARHIDEIIEMFYSGDYDYAASSGLPVGLGFQVFPVKVLAEVDKLSSDPIDRAHVSYYIYNHPERYRLFYRKAEGDMFWPDLRITLDEKADYLLIKNVFEELYSKNKNFSAVDVVRYLKNNPELLEINRHIRQKDPKEG